MPTVRSVMDLVADARERVRNLTVAEVAAQLEEGDLTLVDLREPQEVARTGAIPGAVHAPRGMLEFHADPSTGYHLAELDPRRRTVVYCASGSRSALGALTLQSLGYTDVAHLDGGIDAWAAAGRPLLPISGL